MKYLLSLLLCLPVSVFAAPKADLWLFWTASNQENRQKIAHDAWQQLLDRYLSRNGEYTLFNYAAVSQTDQHKLSRYLSSLAAIDPRTLNRSEQYAYWINLYNAQTVQLILQHYPLDSITQLGGLFSFGPWDDKVLTIAGQTLTLNDIEHRILRPIWLEPRTHYALNCASLGCPNLQPQAFTADNLDQLLDSAAQEFINSEKGAHMQDEKLVLSSIYDWYQVDFGSRQQLIQHLATYRADLSGFRGNIRYQYNWALNEAGAGI
ncbi:MULTISPECIES: DUF547 domain-containing protein [Vibrio]|uniref:DUF547 domain-containing protein n=1 Tax=Vibrio ostreae TaxID=2841925 RepID=A0A975U9W9_9VIBR|nr:MULTISPECIES: DUF547 domain-containing protein [Vibrio]QXO17752.1 DUF547 domain-containing protein [Vibrio ostreae]WGY47927.1 DUF547 domain-containing protein [Vibrio sp. ABG19]